VLRTVSGPRLAAVVIDEAHHLGNDETRRVLVALRIRAKHQWKPAWFAAPLVGLTATPWHTQQEQFGRILRFFGAGSGAAARSRLLRPGSLGSRPVSALVAKRVLARARCETVTVTGTQEMTAAQRHRFEKFKELPADYLEQLGRDPARNAAILDRLVRLSEKRRVLVFACSVKHAEALAMILSQAIGSDVARVVTGDTPRAERFEVIEHFKKGDGVRFLVNVGVLTTGFDAPKVDVVCVARPTTSALLYEQMVGRGLRGPKNGGTESCLVIDVQDEGLPQEVLSYARVLEQWEGTRK
jgi:superfamily II DNA or RNA helicase